MSVWSKDELAVIASTDDLYISVANPDGTMHKPTWIWVAPTVDGGVYVRGYSGVDARWYKAAKAAGHGHVKVDSLEKDVTFEFPTDDATNAVVDAGYQTKYAGSPYLPPMLGKAQRAATVKLTPIV